MDEVFNQHASHVRRKNRSTTNLNRLTLAPLTTRIPIADADDSGALPDFFTSSPYLSTSYLQGRSAPATPSLISRAPGPRPRNATPGARVPALPKSKSTTQLTGALGPGRAADTKDSRRRPRSGYATPNHTARRRRGEEASLEHNDGDWLMRAGALLSSGARESKGQAWLVSRESSISLTGTHDAEAEAFEWELARERAIASRMASRRGSVQFEDEDGREPAEPGSQRGSRRNSRPGSRAGSAPERPAVPDYFSHSGSGGTPAGTPGPDFVNLDDRLEASGQDTTQEDEVVIRRLLKRGSTGVGAWMGSMFGFRLFSGCENGNAQDDEDEDGYDEYDDEEQDDDEDPTRLVDNDGSRSTSGMMRHFEGVSTVPEERIPAPGADEGGWKDAAWLLSVASKVLL